LAEFNDGKGSIPKLSYRIRVVDGLLDAMYVRLSQFEGARRVERSFLTEEEKGESREKVWFDTRE
jgi:hypothetical protein